MRLSEKYSVYTANDRPHCVFLRKKQTNTQTTNRNLRVLDIFEDAKAFGPHVNGVSGTKNAGSWKWSPEWDVLKTPIVDGKKTEFFEYDNVIHHTAHALYDMLSFFHCFSVSVWTGENDFSKTEKKSPFSKISGYFWTRQNIKSRKMLMQGARG